MAQHYTVLLINDRGTPVRETLLSKRFIWMIGALVMITVAILAAGAYRYAHLQKVAANKTLLLSELDEQQSKIENQRKQIQAFAQNINDLKSRLLALNEFEQKIRIIANLEHKNDQASLFAVGGSIPDDIDPSLPLAQDHDRLIREMHTQATQVKQASAIQETSFESLLKSLEDKRNLLAATPSLRPTQGWISSDFGYRVSPFTGRREIHKGLDIASREGTPIIAPADGVVTFAGNKWLMGDMLAIDHGYGVVTRYGHLSKLLKTNSAKVKRGEVIALMGNTGRSTGPHLHYEVRLNGVPVDPMRYILD